MKTKKTITNPLDMIKGLMFEKTGEIELEMVLARPTRIGASVHTFFMNYPIEVEWYDEDRNLIEKMIMAPWMPSHTPKSPAKYIVERKWGTI